MSTPKKLVFLGREFDTDGEFATAFPAYGHYASMVRAGADTPHKVEVEIYRRNCRNRTSAARLGAIKKRRRAVA